VRDVDNYMICLTSLLIFFLSLLRFPHRECMKLTFNSDAVSDSQNI
jgi:hypothetical protein